MNYSGIPPEHVKVLKISFQAHEAGKEPDDSKSQGGAAANAPLHGNINVSLLNSHHFGEISSDSVHFLGWRLMIIDSISFIKSSDDYVLFGKNLFLVADDPGLLHRIELSVTMAKTSSFNTSVIKCENVSKRFRKISATETDMYAVTEDHCLYKVKISEQFIPDCRLLDVNGCKVKDISCGKEHIVVLTILGEVFTFGSGSRGQIGHGTLDNCEILFHVDALSGVFIRQVKAGGWHTLALSDIGDIYAWGWNESGQVGIPCTKNSLAQVKKEKASGTTMVMYPTLLFADDDDITFEEISCGTRHSAALSDGGKLFTWGWNGYGQLFQDKEIVLCDIPTEVSVPGCQMIQHVECSGWSTLAF